MNGYFFNKLSGSESSTIHKRGDSMKLAAHRLCWLLMGFLVLVGMGSNSGGGPGQVTLPEPTRNFAATIIDQSNTNTRVEKFSLDGHTSIWGKLGSGFVTIGFEQVASIGLTRQEKVLRANILLKDGKQVLVELDKGILCYGKLPYGEFKVSIADVKSIVINGLAPAR